ncbi:hypothetical protein Sjap_000011 [Stephania japonica]|uniref:Uncharacterized protein n=1 Tax=Stephania japonica TaxID=461633 RepID=A0AAP0PTM0_9MAGN
MGTSLGYVTNKFIAQFKREVVPRRYCFGLHLTDTKAHDQSVQLSESICDFFFFSLWFSICQ